MDSICALATPLGGAVALIRASGPLCVMAMQALVSKPLQPRRMTRAALHFDGVLLDEAMAAYFPGPYSYTGEDTLELYCHGSPAAVRAVLDALLKTGFRPAAPGEFTKRAFLNGKMDLSQAEAVMDLIQAEASESAKTALIQMQGRLRKEVEDVERLLYDALSALSAAIDYPEELEQDVYAALPMELESARAKLKALIEQGARGRVLREGFRVVLLGAPNAGKSSLLNALLGYERAIVTPQAGTTRDTLEEKLLFEGIPFLFTDTAGLRDTEDIAEAQGVQRAKGAAKEADLALLLLDATDKHGARMEGFVQAAGHIPCMLLRTKTDLPPLWNFTSAHKAYEQLDVSAKTGAGLNALLQALKAHVGSIEGAYVTNQRHIYALEDALVHVGEAQSARELDCAAIDIRGALLSLGAITGKEVDETVIDAIFARFCVGK